MKILKTRKVKTPTRGTEKSAGLDFYIPDNHYKHLPNGSCWVAPGECQVIPSGIKVKVPEGYALIAMNKSGIAKYGFQVGACVIDEDYQGEIHLHVVNISDSELLLQSGQKLVQMLLIPVLYGGIEVVKDEKDLYPEGESERGSGGFGSTGLK